MHTKGPIVATKNEASPHERRGSSRFSLGDIFHPDLATLRLHEPQIQGPSPRLINWLCFYGVDQVGLKSIVSYNLATHLPSYPSSLNPLFTSSCDNTLSWHNQQITRHILNRYFPIPPGRYSVSQVDWSIQLHGRQRPRELASTTVSSSSTLARILSARVRNGHFPQIAR